MWTPNSSPRSLRILLLINASILLLPLPPAVLNFVEAGSATGGWILDQHGRNSQLERESSPPNLLSPVQVASARFASQLFNGRHPMGSVHEQQQQPEVDLFQCVEPTRQLFQNFVETYNRTFEDNIEQLERWGLFMNTLKRTIMLNRIVQNEISNETNYDLKPSIGDYHFISPLGAKNVALWYADITDCELGLIKYIMFNIIYHIDNNDLPEAYKVALDNSRYLPLMNGDGFEQLANILLVRLYDRFRGDEQMNKLFQWPLYVKKLAGYVYNRRQVEQPDFDEKLTLISYAYPAYFKDLKYNQLAINRTGDNNRAHEDHERFNKFHNRRFVNNRERNKRLSIFRQRWTLINQLNGVHKRDWQNVTTRPEWLRNQQQQQQQQPSYYFGAGQSEKLQAGDETTQGDGQLAAQGDQQWLSSYPEGRFKHTQFSDLTDAEFVAYLTNDFSLLDNNMESADYIDNNFPIRYLSEKFKNELALELELRRALQPPSGSQKPLGGADSSAPQQRANFLLARRVIDELISDVGLPIGAVAVNKIPEDEHYGLFTKVSRFFGKSYGQPGERLRGTTGGNRASPFGAPNEPELADERQRRYDQFKANYARFKSWFIKEGWTGLGESHLVAMLRLADMSWPEIKLTLFKVCCLTDETLSLVSATNSTLHYLGSNQFLCQPLSRDSIREQQQQLQQQNLQAQTQTPVGIDFNNSQASELAALELYYYYSVHFNKHHSDMDTFNKRFAIFRHNIEQIRKHSCTRGLTIYRSLIRKRVDPLSSIDPLDPRRSYTDDINLDRYRYFIVPNLELQPHQQQQFLDDLADPDEGFEKLRAVPSNDAAKLQVSNETPSRAGISYRRNSFFSSLLDNPDQRIQQQQQANKLNNFSYADKLIGSAQNFNLQAQKYRQNSVSRVYELVMQRYNYCTRTVRKIDTNARRQNCQASGPLAEQSANSWQLPMRNQLGSARESLELKEQDPCAFYRTGLEAWDEGLMKQNSLSAELIPVAKCYAQ